MNSRKNRIFGPAKRIGKVLKSALVFLLGVISCRLHAAPVDEGPVSATNIQSASLVLKLRNKSQLVDFVFSTMAWVCLI